MPGTAPKVAIPRSRSLSSQSERRRSARACEPCRQRKIKCDGNKPSCRQCVEHDVRCTYMDVKRVRDQKLLGALAKKVDRYEKLLEDLEGQVDAPMARRIRKALKASNEPLPTTDEYPDSDDDSESIGSLDNIDLVEEDLNRNERTVAMGFFGKNSEVSWMQRLVDEASNLSIQSSEHVEQQDQVTSGQSAVHKPGYSISMLSYHLDDLSIPILESVDPYALPPKELADRFFGAYLESVYPTFMVIRRKTFADQYEKFYREPSHPPRTWLAILNLIFAIGSRYLRLINSSDAGDMDDLVYLNRARKLALSGNVLFEHADLQQIQVEALAAFYLLSLDQVNRSFRLSSLAFRSALSLGINLRFVDDRTQNAAKEARSRLWWAIYIFEYLLASITGRVSCVGECLTATPLPVPFEEDNFHRPEALCLLQDTPLRASRLKMTLLQSREEAQASAEWLAICPPSPSLLFHCIADLIAITQAIINKVYSLQGLRDRPSQVEQRIRKYAAILEAWLSKVPEVYRFTERHSERLFMPENSPFLRERVYLAFSFYSAKISLCRPCLSHANMKADLADRPTHRTRFRTDMALTCLRASCSLISILPDDPDIIWLARITPWWSALHFIMQATTALLLGLMCWPRVEKDDRILTASQTISKAMMLTSTRKAFRWLYTMSEKNVAFRRAFLNVDNALRQIAPILELDISDFPDGSTLSPASDNILGGEKIGLDFLDI
ncbi:fungal-specific transcription factor [Aspergillus steynii IBT 23096]|uniref:Fungal-specific transcription factor n=1 Tax=Aspergillus steynii IBT 23096 TaxID=1392250 RepID=A0A2I2G9U1_9EURO|nr:fungal-specific transcription factor [Aspergillus steynii IBT 23096]PLB49635.1 fungal-specific transcription factor [Aspergillus steynii IBT 23096]